VEVIKAGETVNIEKFSKSDCHLQVIGAGSFVIMKSLYLTKGGVPYPLTDSSGEIVEFSGADEDGVIFNGELTNDNQWVNYHIHCTDGELKYQVAI
jgi:hypothetical protein